MGAYLQAIYLVAEGVHPVLMQYLHRLLRPVHAQDDDGLPVFAWLAGAPKGILNIILVLVNIHKLLLHQVASARITCGIICCARSRRLPPQRMTMSLPWQSWAAVRLISRASRACLVSAFLLALILEEVLYVLEEFLGVVSRLAIFGSGLLRQLLEVFDEPLCLFPERLL